jgi:hypothetical protein
MRTAALRHKLPVTMMAQGSRDSPMLTVRMKPQYKTVKNHWRQFGGQIARMG